MTSNRNLLSGIILFFLLIPAILTFSGSAWPDEIYQFERMWPTLKQPWYFNEPYSVAADKYDYIYITDKLNKQILKYSSDGHFITKWGSNILGRPWGVTVDFNGYVYAVSADKIWKFAPDGRYIDNVGEKGNGDAMFNGLKGIAADQHNNLYVADEKNDSVQVFDSDLNFIRRWGSSGSGPGAFSGPIGIAVDENRRVYVADTGNSRIQIFTAEGDFVSEWREWEATDTVPAGRFGAPVGITIDVRGNVCVTDVDPEQADDVSSRILVFSTAGIPLHETTWKWHSLWGIAANSRGDIYVTDTASHVESVFKCSSAGEQIASFQSYGDENGKFRFPREIFIDPEGNFYVTELGNVRIQKFDSRGRFVEKWEFGELDWDLLEIIIALYNGTWDSIDDVDPRLYDILLPLVGAYDPETSTFDLSGLDAGLNELFRERLFHFPAGLVLDKNGDMYVCDSTYGCIHRIRTGTGEIEECVISNPHPDKLFMPSRITVSQEGTFYVTDFASNRVFKFDENGKKTGEWGGNGTEDGQFMQPDGIAVDEEGNVLVVDTLNDCVRKFGPDGSFLSKLVDELIHPAGIALDAQGNLYVSGNFHVRKYNSQGELITQWGEKGVNLGQFNYADGIAVDSEGTVFVVDQENDRIQSFAKVDKPARNKAIIVAGRRPNDRLWDATLMCANFAYRTLLYQGFTHDSIRYLTSESQLDLDGDGVPDTDGDATNDNLRQAFSDLASEDTDSLILYFVDHGGENTFQMSGSELLSGDDLNTWLTEFEDCIDGGITVVYDACRSGSFIPKISDQGRIVITSASADESALFAAQGSVSFSVYFWTKIFNCANVGDAFQTAAEAMETRQNALLDANGNGIPNEDEDVRLAAMTFIGKGIQIPEEAPEIRSIPEDMVISGSESVRIFAKVRSAIPITRVWADIRTPEYAHNSSDDSTIGLFEKELEFVEGEHFEAEFAGFATDGAHVVSIFAEDKNFNKSIPKSFTVQVNDPIRRRAILVAAGAPNDGLWPAIEKGIKKAFDALIFQGYSNGDIRLIASTNIPEVPVIPESPDPENLKNAIETWATQDVRDLVVYVIGNGGNETLTIAGNEITATDLDTWLDTFQNATDAELTFVCDAGKSGSLIRPLKPDTGRNRILIASSPEEHPAFFMLDGEISFSTYFWKEVFDGATVWEAFERTLHGANFTFGESLWARLDDSGNGVANEGNIDGALAKQYHIGTGILVAGTGPVIGEPAADVSGDSLMISIDNITAVDGVEKVWAVIFPPDYIPSVNEMAQPPMIELGFSEGNQYSGHYNGLSSDGTYTVSIYAMDKTGSVSEPKSITVTQKSANPDAFEPDDSSSDATYIVKNDPEARRHNFHKDGDEDWVRFYALSGKTYDIEATNLESNCDPAITLYDENLNILREWNSLSSDTEERWSWPCEADGVCFVKVYSADPNKYGENTGYDLAVSSPIAGLPGWLEGFVRDSSTKDPIQDAKVIISLNDVRTEGFDTNPDGWYSIHYESGEYTVSVSASGYQTITATGVKIPEDGRNPKDFELSSAIQCSDGTDSDGDGTPDCEDSCPDDPAKTEPGESGCGNPEPTGGNEGEGGGGGCFVRSVD